MEETRLKMDIELHVVGDGRTFLNYWNYVDGEDVVAELKNGELHIGKKVVSLQEFIDSIKKKLNNT